MAKFGENPSGNIETEFIGTISEIKSGDSKTIKVFINQLTPAWSGKLEATTKQYSVSGGTGGYSGSATASNHVIATYKGDSSNRRYCPDVVVGEEVRVFTNATNPSIWYWEPTNKNQNQRVEGERVGQIANNAENPEDLNESNTYGTEVNTKAQYIKIYTSKSKGELFKYTIMINAKEGKVSIADDAENLIELDSNVPRIVLKNKNGSFVDIDQDNVTVAAVNTLTLKGGKQTIFETPALSMKNNTMGGGAVVWDANEIQINSKSFITNSECIGMYGNMEAPNIKSNNIESPNIYKGGGIGGSSTASISSAMLRSNPGLYSRFANLTRETRNSNSNFPGTYKGPSINIKTGEVTLANNSPNPVSPPASGNDNHSTEWLYMVEMAKQFQAAINLIAQNLEVLGGDGIDEITSHTKLAVNAAIQSKMD